MNINKLVHDISFRLMATNKHDDMEWLKETIIKSIEKECDDYGDYREEIGKVKMVVNHNLPTKTYKEWVDEDQT